MIRLLSERDIPDLMRLKETANWNQTEQDWRNVMRLAPDGCFGIERGGRVEACATAVCYGTELAWIGMVLTAPEWRGQGLARRLMEHAMAHIEARGVAAMKLDATEMGWPLYAKLGFVDECSIERWARPAGAWTGAVPVAPVLLPYVGGLDRELGNGRPGSNAAYFGPCATESVQDARAALERFLAEYGAGRTFWDVLPGNAEAVELAREYGFAPLRKLIRMSRPQVPFDYSKIFAIAGFEYG